MTFITLGDPSPLDARPLVWDNELQGSSVKHVLHRWIQNLVRRSNCHYGVTNSTYGIICDTVNGQIHDVFTGPSDTEARTCYQPKLPAFLQPENKNQHLTPPKEYLLLIHIFQFRDRKWQPAQRLWTLRQTPPPRLCLTTPTQAPCVLPTRRSETPLSCTWNPKPFWRADVSINQPRAVTLCQKLLYFQLLVLRYNMAPSSLTH